MKTRTTGTRQFGNPKSNNINVFRKVQPDKKRPSRSFFEDELNPGKNLGNFDKDLKKVSGQVVSSPGHSTVFDNNFSANHDASVTPTEVINMFGFNQIETALIAFCGDLQLKLQYVLPTLPVFVLQTGDESYLFRKKFEHLESKEVLEKTPRFVIKFENVTFLNDQNTMQYNDFVFNYGGINYQCVGRRVAVEFQISTFFVSPNFVKGLQNIEILASLFSHDNVFSYQYAGLTFESAYSSMSNAEEYPSMEVSQQSKNMALNNQITLQIQLMSPRVETIKRFDENWGGGGGFDPVFDINIKQDGEITDTSTLDTRDGEEDEPITPENNTGIGGAETIEEINEANKDKIVKRVNASIDLPTKNPVYYDGKEDADIKLPTTRPAYMNDGGEKYDIPDSMPKPMKDDNDKTYDLGE